MSFNLKSKEGTAGITALLVIAIVCAVNFLVGGLSFLNFRVDITEDKLYTLSPGTRNILEHLNPDKPVTIRYYVTTDDRVMPPVLKAHARTVQDLLLEFQKAHKDKIILEKRIPNPNTEDEDKAREDEIQGMQINAAGDNVYLGLAIQSGVQKEVLPFLNPNEETALEYNIARAIAKVSKTGKTVIGVMSALPLHGSPMYPYQRQRGQEPWIAIQRLRLDYEVREVQLGADKIDSDISVLVVIHPADITEGSEYAIDQFLLKGGKVIAMVDPQSWIAQAYSGQQNPMTGQPGGVINPASNLSHLFNAWGVGFNKSQVVADVNFQGMMQGRKNPTALNLPGEAMNRTDRITADLQSLMMMSAGAFTTDEKKPGLESVILVQSSEASELIDVTESEKLRTQNLTTFSPSGHKQTLGLRLTGKFRTAFPNGKPKGVPKGPAETGGAQDDANAPKAATPPGAAPATTPPSAAPAATPPSAAPTVTPPAPTPPAAVAPAAPTTPAPSVAPAKSATPAVVAPAPAAPAPAPVTSAPKAPAAPAPATSATPAAPAPAAAQPATDDGSLKESVNNEGAVVLLSDVDMLYDAFCVQQDQMTGGLIAVNSNLPLFLNTVELMSGGGDLLQVRSRASTRRPFTKMVEKREAVEKIYRPQLQQKEAELQTIVQEMGPLRIKNGQLADATQIKKLEALQKKQIEINRDIRDIKKTQNKDVEYTQSVLTLLNVFAVPLLVIAIGVILAIRRRVTTAAV